MTHASDSERRMQTLPRILVLPLIAISFLFANLSPAAPTPVPGAPDLEAKAFILVDFLSGKIIAEKNADERLDPASLTKLMTAYIVFKELKNGQIQRADLVTVSEKAWRMRGSRMFIEVGDKVPVGELLKGMIIQSGNDASVALAEHIAGDEATFATMMNRQAKALGMSGSNFENATGLTGENHYVTPRDIATLSAALIRDFPDDYSLYSERSYTFNKITQRNRNKLLWRDDSVDGLKTGYTQAAGYCLAASAKREDTRLISVVMGARSTKARAAQSQTLLNFGFRFYETRKLYAANAELLKVPAFKGESKELKLGLVADLFVTIPRGHEQNLKASTSAPAHVIAPVTRNSQQGKLTIKLSDEVIAERPLVALDNIAEGGLWTQVVDGVQLWFE